MDLLPLSLLNDYLFCPRRAGLKLLEGLRGENEHTVKGDIVHERVDTPGEHTARGVVVLRALPVWSERLGLIGICDIVEIHRVASGGDGGSDDFKFEISDLRGEASGNFKSQISNFKSEIRVQPVEFKKGPRRKFENDDVQVCAQALCLEEVLGVRIEHGAIYFAASKHRREIVMSEELRELTVRTAAALHALLDTPASPAAEPKPACERCSLIDECLPEATRGNRRSAAAWFLRESQI